MAASSRMAAREARARPRSRARADRVIARARGVDGTTVLFAHGHLFRVLAARWLGWPPAAGAHLLLDPATVSVLERLPRHPRDQALESLHRTERRSTSWSTPSIEHAERPLAGRRAALMRRLLAGLQLPGGRHDLPAGQPAAAGAAADGARQAPPARPLGRQPRAVVRLGAPQPADRARRPRRDVRRRARPRRARRARPRLPRGHLLRGLSGQERGPGGPRQVLQAVLLPRPHRQPRHARRRPARSTRAASSATACRTPTAWRSTTPT